MKKLATVALLLSLSVAAYAQKPCDELKGEIAKKIEASGVKTYSLDIVAKDKEAEGKVVGTCEGGTKKIVYKRSGAAPAPASEAKK